MAFEKGGRTDKFGSRYERRYVVFLMIQLLQGNIESFVCKPVGPEESGVDILVYLKDGSKEFHQCKSRNGDYDKWTLSSLRKHKIFEHIAEHVIDNTTKYVFVSPLPFTEFSDLCLQAKNSPSSKCFLRVN